MTVDGSVLTRHLVVRLTASTVSQPRWQVEACRCAPARRASAILAVGIAAMLGAGPRPVPLPRGLGWASAWGAAPAGVRGETEARSSIAPRPLAPLQGAGHNCAVSGGVARRLAQPPAIVWHASSVRPKAMGSHASAREGWACGSYRRPLDAPARPDGAGRPGFTAA